MFLDGPEIQHHKNNSEKLFTMNLTKILPRVFFLFLITSFLGRGGVISEEMPISSSTSTSTMIITNADYLEFKKATAPSPVEINKTLDLAAAKVDWILEDIEVFLSWKNKSDDRYHYSLLEEEEVLTWRAVREGELSTAAYWYLGAESQLFLTDYSLASGMLLLHQEVDNSRVDNSSSRNHANTPAINSSNINANHESNGSSSTKSTVSAVGSFFDDFFHATALLGIFGYFGPEGIIIAYAYILSDLQLTPPPWNKNQSRYLHDDENGKYLRDGHPERLSVYP